MSMNKKNQNYVWYACYGSNLYKKRFMEYIKKCPDPSSPKGDKKILVPYPLYFAKESSRWGGGVAFIGLRKNRKNPSLGRMYLITEEQFEDTLNLITWMNANITNISRFSLRPQIEAHKLKQIHGRITKERSTKALTLTKTISLKQKEKWVGKTVRVIIDEYGKKDTLIGRTDYYDPVVLATGEIGDVRNVKITAATPYYLKGTIID